MEAHKEPDCLVLVHFSLYKTWFVQEKHIGILYDAVRTDIWQTENQSLKVGAHHHHTLEQDFELFIN